MAPAPSPSTNPSRVASNGREAVAGSSFRVERARMAANPPMPMSVTLASVPPTTMTSARPRSMSSAPSTMALLLEAHAETVAKLGPRRPCRIEIWPGAMSMIIMGTKNGESRRGPWCANPTTWSWNIFIPPMPDPKTTPVRACCSSVNVDVSIPASARASSEATSAYWQNASRRRASLRSRWSPGSKPLTSHANVVEISEGSNLVMGAAPLLPSIMASQ